MILKEHPKALQLADACDVQATAWIGGCPAHTERMQTASELRRQHASIVELESLLAHMTDLWVLAHNERSAAMTKVSELESQLESIGAGGVTRLVALPDAEPVAYWIPKAEQFCIAKPERPFARVWQPLYATPQPAIAPAPLPDRYVWEQFYLSDCGMCWGDRQSAYNPTLPEYREFHEGINWHNVNEVRNFRPLYATPQPAIAAAHLRMLEDYLLAAQIAEGYRPDECPPLTMPLAGALYAKLQPAIAPEPLDVEAWAELHTLREAVKGPGCFDTWQDAAVHERLRVNEVEKTLAELEAARYAYASEFPLAEDGEPDKGSIHQNIRALKAETALLRADAARLNWIESKGWPLMGWTCRDSVTGRGYRLHQGAQYLSMTAREAIDAAIKEAKP